MTTIKVNGKEQPHDVATSLSQLIKLNNVENPSMVSVQLNGNFVNRADFDSTTINAGDEVDFLYFMGGGQHSRNKPHRHTTSTQSTLRLSNFTTF